MSYSLPVRVTRFALAASAAASLSACGINSVPAAEETAKEVGQILEKNKITNPVTQKGRVQYFVTDNPAQFTRIGRRFLGHAIPPAKRMSLELF